MTATAERVLTCLLVEDNDDHAELVERCVRYGNLPVRLYRASSGVDCLAYLDSQGPRPDGDPAEYPDVVLMDIRTADPLDGLHTLRAIRADPRHRSLRVVMLTSSDDEMAMRRAYELGAYRFVVKSFDPHELTQKLRQALADLVAALSPNPHPSPLGGRGAGGEGTNRTDSGDQLRAYPKTCEVSEDFGSLVRFGLAPGLYSDNKENPS